MKYCKIIAILLIFYSCAYKVSNGSKSSSLLKNGSEFLNKETLTVEVFNDRMRVLLKSSDFKKKCLNLKRYEYFRKVACNIIEYLSQTVKGNRIALSVEVISPDMTVYKRSWNYLNYLSLTLIPYWSTTEYKIQYKILNPINDYQKVISLSKKIFEIRSFVILPFTLFIDDRVDKEGEVLNSIKRELLMEIKKVYILK